MKYRIPLILATMLWLIPAVLAANSILTVKETVTFDFTGERAFTAIFPGGAQRTFTWNENETHSDTTFDRDIYFPFVEEDYCNNTVQYAESYKNMSDTLSSVVNTCDGVLKHLNTTINISENLTGEVLAAKRDRDEYVRLWKTAETRAATAVNATEQAKADCETWRSERDSYKSQYDSCTNSLSNVRAATPVSAASVEDCEDDKTLSMAIAAVIGGIIGYFIGRKLKGGGPSEQAEVGAYGDMPRQRREGPPL